MTVRVLVVDNESESLQVLQSALSNAGFQPVTAGSAEGALLTFQTEPFDLLITDMKTPGNEFPEFMKKLGALDKFVEVIVLAGQGTLNNAMGALEGTGVFEYLTTPLTDLNLVRLTVGRALSRRRLREENERLFAEVTRTREELLEKQWLESLPVLAREFAHAFGNISNVILGNISLAGEETSIKTARARLAAAEKAVLSAQQLNSQLMAIAEGGAGVHPASIGVLLRRAVERNLSGSGIETTFRIAEDLRSVICDPRQIELMIANVTMNARNAMPHGGMLEVCAENVCLLDTGYASPEDCEHLRIAIEDHGPGIPEKDLRKVFDLSFTTNPQDTRGEVTGLRLAAVRSIVRRHRGQIKVHSRVGFGTTVEIFLPVFKGQPAPEQKPLPKVPLHEGIKRVLVMEEIVQLRDLFVAMLELSGFQAVSCREGSEAVRLYREAIESDTPFDAVLLDLTVATGMGGRETIRQLLEIDPAVRAIVSSGYPNDPVMVDYRQYGFRGALVKPFRRADLQAVLERVLQP